MENDPTIWRLSHSQFVKRVFDKREMPSYLNPPKTTCIPEGKKIRDELKAHTSVLTSFGECSMSVNRHPYTTPASSKSSVSGNACRNTGRTCAIGMMPGRARIIRATAAAALSRTPGSSSGEKSG